MIDWSGRSRATWNRLASALPIDLLFRRIRTDRLADQLTVIFAVTLAITVGSITVIWVERYARLASQEREAAADSVGRSVSVLVADAVVTRDLLVIERVAADASGFPGITAVEVFGIDGRLLGTAGSRPPGSVAIGAIATSDISAALEAVAQPGVRWKRIETGSDSAWVRVRYGLESIENARREIWIGGALMAVVSIAAAIVLLRLVLFQPMALLDETARFAKGMVESKGASLDAQAGAREVRTLRQSLNAASQGLFEQEAALRAANEGLEQRVMERTAELAKSLERLQGAQRQVVSLAEDVAVRERSFRTLVERSPVGILIRPESSGQIYANRALFGIFDAAADQGDPGADKMRSIMSVVCDGAAAPAGEGSRIVEWHRAGGRRGFAQVQEISIDWKEGGASLFAVTDVTENHEAQLKLAKASQLATLGELSTAVAHEINQPLAVIALAARNARSALTGGSFEIPSLARKLERIVRQVDRAKSITDHMCLFGRGSVDDPVPFGLSESVRSACRFVREQYVLADIRLDLADVPDTPCRVVGHQIQLEQVILNLLTNARDAFAGTKRRAGSRNRPVVRISIGNRDDRTWTIAVKDNAGGIGESVIERVFEPFFSTKPVGQGTGLGLSVAYGIVRDMGGAISVRNEDGGACFEIDLPRAEVERSGPV